MGVKRIWIGLAALAIVAFLVVGLLQANEGGSDKPKSAATSSAKVRAELAGAPAPLAELHAEDSQIIGGGAGGVQARPAGLKGHPRLGEKGGSWGGARRAGVPGFPKAAVKYG